MPLFRKRSPARGDDPTVASGPGLADLSNAKAGLDELVAVVEQQPDAEDWDLVEALVSRGLEMKLIVPVRRRSV
jgi:hypothetical protein